MDLCDSTNYQVYIVKQQHTSYYVIILCHLSMRFEFKRCNMYNAYNFALDQFALVLAFCNNFFSESKYVWLVKIFLKREVNRVSLSVFEIVTTKLNKALNIFYQSYKNKVYWRVKFTFTIKFSERFCLLAMGLDREGAESLPQIHKIVLFF